MSAPEYSAILLVVTPRYLNRRSTGVLSGVHIYTHSQAGPGLPRAPPSE